jgi:hypothetical protein
MESKLQDAVRGEDWYSAHQIYLALAQKHHRANRKKELMKTLGEGIQVLSKVKQNNSVIQLADKFVEYSSTCEYDDFCLFIEDVYEALWELDQEFCLKFGNSLLEKNRLTCNKLYSGAQKVGSEEAGRYLLFLEELPSSLHDSFLIMEDDCFLRLVVRCLVSKDFKLAGEVIKAKLNSIGTNKKPIDDPSGTLASFTAITPNAFLDLAQLLFMTCQRKCEKGLYVGLIEQNSWATKIIPDDWLRCLERVYWPPAPSRPSASPPMNQFAQMFQNLFPQPSPSQPPRPQADDLD